MSTGFGRTVYCYGPNGLQPGRSLSGRAALAASIWRHLVTERGTLQGGAEELAWGIDVRNLVGAATSSDQLAQLPSQVEAELSKDQRIAAVEASVTSREEAGRFYATLRIVVTPADETDSFALTLDVSDVTVTILGGLSS